MLVPGTAKSFSPCGQVTLGAPSRAPTSKATLTAVSPPARSADVGVATRWMPPRTPCMASPLPTEYCVASAPFPCPRIVVMASAPPSSTATSLGHHDVGMWPAGVILGGAAARSTSHAPTALSPASDA